MEEIPRSWIDKVFSCLENFYGNRWQKSKGEEESYLRKNMWFNALKNLSYEQINKGLAICKNISLNSFMKAPSAIKFYHFCLNPVKLESKKKNFFTRDVPRRTSNKIK